MRTKILVSSMCVALCISCISPLSALASPPSTGSPSPGYAGHALTAAQTAVANAKQSKANLYYQKKFLGGRGSVSPLSAFASLPSTGSPSPGYAGHALTAAQAAVANAKQSKANLYYQKKFLSGKGSAKIGAGVSPNSESTSYKSLGVQTTIENPDDNCGPAATFQDSSWKNPGNYYFQSDNDNPNNYPE